MRGYCSGSHRWEGVGARLRLRGPRERRIVPELPAPAYYGNFFPRSGSEKFFIIVANQPEKLAYWHCPESGPFASRVRPGELQALTRDFISRSGAGVRVLRSKGLSP
eukprot:756800-Hanusia_phi.AAC.2